MGNHKLIKISKKLKVYIKMEKAIIKFGDTEIEKQIFHQHKKPISIKDVDINEIVVSDKVSFGKMGFKYFIGYKYAKKLDIYVYLSQKWVHIEETLMKLNIYFL